MTPVSTARPVSAPDTTEVRATARPRILVVDDEQSMRDMLRIVLRRDGYDVVIAESGRQGLERLKSEPFDLLLSDIRMPGVGGREFLAGLGRERPELVPRLLFSSGDTAAPDTAALLRESGVPSIVKPLDFAQLEQVIRDIATLKTSA